MITAGAGTGVDSSLPDFRGPEGFWRAYPAYRNLGHNLMDMADARRFRVDPTLVWFCDSEGDEDRTAWQQEGWRTGLSRFATDHARSWS